MADKHFEAILAKNLIARHIKEIEDYIGEGNQPSVKSIMNNDNI